MTMSDWVLTRFECSAIDDIIDEYNSLPKGTTLIREFGEGKTLIFVDIEEDIYYHGYICKGKAVYFELCCNSQPPFCYKFNYTPIEYDEDYRRFTISLMSRIGSVDKTFKIKEEEE